MIGNRLNIIGPAMERFLLLLGTTVIWFVSSNHCIVAAERTNFLFAIADDWGWPHAGCYGDPVVQTPAFDRIARRGVLFSHAFVSSPSCTPSRSAILAGQYHWRLQAAANLYGSFPDSVGTFCEMLRNDSYQTGVTGKGWGPGRPQSPRRQLIGRRYQSIDQFLAQLEPDRPFCFWLGSSDPHRPYRDGSGRASGMDLSQIQLPKCFPDALAVRNDVADYYYEVQRFDRLVAAAMNSLKSHGLLNNTLIVMTSDHGMPFPRCKSNLYDTGSRVPLAICYGDRFAGNRTSTDFVSLIDMAPTILDFAGVAIDDSMTGRSLRSILESSRQGRVTDRRVSVIFGKERHVPAQVRPDMGGYPSRAIRTDEYLLIRNYAPHRWPNGTPDFENAAVPGNWYADTDNGPTKSYIIENRNRDAAHEQSYKLSFGKRPEYELYDLADDPAQLTNVAAEPKYADVLKRLQDQLQEALVASKDPRETGVPFDFDAVKYTGGGPKHPNWKSKRDE